MSAKITTDQVVNNDLVLQVSDSVSTILARRKFFQRRNNSTIQAISTSIAVLVSVSPALVGIHWGWGVALGVLIVILSTMAQAFTKGTLSQSAANEVIAEVAKNVATPTQVEPANPFRDYYAL